MIRNTLIALAAVSAAGIAMASVAEAKTRVNFDIGINLGAGGIYVGPGPAYYDGGYMAVDDECGWHLVRHKTWNASHTKKFVFFTKEYVCG